jgi:phosphoglycolate phosphatase
MVGDREHDIFGAHENAIPCAGVLWGYGSQEEFAAAGAEYIVKDCAELLELAGGN